MFYNICPCGLYYEHITIVNDDSIVVESLTDDTRVVIDDRNTFIIQATDVRGKSQ
jgi:hypothetical protein